MQIGVFNKLVIARFSSFGAYLVDSHKQEVLLPKKFLQPSHRLNDSIDVFVTTDSSDRIVATTQIPFAKYGEIAILKVKSITDFGCFLDIGLDKDIFMPSKNPKRFSVGQKVCVYITLDKQNRMIAKLGVREYFRPFVRRDKCHLKFKAVAFDKTNLGFSCIVDEKYYGILYFNTLKTEIKLFEPIEVRIQKIRQDGKIDLRLDEEKSILLLKQKIQVQGILDFNYDSDAGKIQQVFGMSKKLFKKTLTQLIKQKFIKLENNKIYYLN